MTVPYVLQRANKYITMEAIVLSKHKGDTQEVTIGATIISLDPEVTMIKKKID